LMQHVDDGIMPELDFAHWEPFAAPMDSRESGNDSVRPIETFRTSLFDHEVGKVLSLGAILYKHSGRHVQSRAKRLYRGWRAMDRIELGAFQMS
jgi:hypothetical protein